MWLNPSQCFGTGPGVENFCSSQKMFCSRKMFFHWNCLRININGIIHVNLKLAVILKLLQLCIFIHNVLSFYLCFSIFITLWCLTCNNLQHTFPPISDNNYFSFYIPFLIRILDVFNCLAYISLRFKFNSRPIFVLFTIRDPRFSLTVKMPSLPQIYQPWSIFWFFPMFWTTRNPVI